MALPECRLRELTLVLIYCACAPVRLTVFHLPAWSWNKIRSSAWVWVHPADAG